jgi:photosystem II stability/assembly factor-like uncharacterized protein
MYARSLAPAFVLLSFAAHAQQFTWDRPTLTGNDLNDVTFRPNSTVGYAVGGKGVILKTTSSGASWFPVTSGTTQRLNAIDCVSDTTCRVVGEGGTLRKTTDGGNTWVAEASGTTASLLDIEMLDADTGWIAGQGVVLKTIDAGGSWLPQTLSTSSWVYYAVFPISSSVVYVLSNATAGFGTPYPVFKTTNGGMGWTQQTVGSVALRGDFVDANNGIVVGFGAVRHTTNGGMTW